MRFFGVRELQIGFRGRGEDFEIRSSLCVVERASMYKSKGLFLECFFMVSSCGDLTHLYHAGFGSGS